MHEAEYFGHCACGAVRYVARHAPVNPHFCHCETCRRSSGAPVVAWVNFPQTDFTWLRGEPAWFASSPDMRRGFCPQCGTALCTDEGDGYVCVTIASLDRPEDVAPQYHIYVQHALDWLKQDDSLPREVREDRF